MKKIEYEKRTCDLCNGKSLEQLWSYREIVKTRTRAFEWDVSNVVCRNCGFAFVSPAPTERSLSEYYSDNHVYWQGEVIEFSIDKRLRLLEKHIPSGEKVNFLEIGGNSLTRFQKELTRVVSGYRSVELNSACSSDYRTLEDVPREVADVVAAYFVLEHVPKPGKFLKACFDLLKPRGKLIIEVPNLYIYSHNPAGILFFEHTNHFSPKTLAGIAAAQGLRLVDVNFSDCSRPYGFVAVFEKANVQLCGESHKLGADPHEYFVARACIVEGAAHYTSYLDQLSSIRQKIINASFQERNVVIWGANHRCIELLRGFDVPPNCTFVDSNPNKRSFLETAQVYQPHEVAEKLQTAEIFIITTKLYSSEIIDAIEQIAGRRPIDQNLIVIDPGFDIAVYQN